MWMSYEDQEAYKAHVITAPTVVETTQQEVAINALTTKSIYQYQIDYNDNEKNNQDKLAKLRESEQKAQYLLQQSLGSQQDNKKKALQERLRKKKEGKE